MTTLDALTTRGWTAREGTYSSFPCDVCGAPATFARMDAPDSNVWALAGVGGAHSDVYGIYCSPACQHVV